MFLSLVRPERISSPITKSAAVTRLRAEEVVAVMRVLMRGRRERVPLACQCGRCRFKPPGAGNRNYPGDQVCSGTADTGKVRGLSIRDGDDDVRYHPPPWPGPQRPRRDHAAGARHHRMGAV